MRRKSRCPMRWPRDGSGPLGRFETGSRNSTGPATPGWGQQPVEAAEVCPQSAPSGPRQGRPTVAGSLEKRGLQQALAGAGVSRSTALGFADEMRVGLRGMVRRVWGGRGVKVPQRLQLAYYWRYLFLVVNAQAGKLHWCWLDSLAGAQMGAAVGGLQKHTEVASVVWDGALGHWGEWVRALGRPLIGLPPYSPELNPAERVFQEVRRAIEGKVYTTLEDKMTAVAEFLRELEADPERVRSLPGGTGSRLPSSNSPSIMRHDHSDLVLLSLLGDSN